MDAAPKSAPPPEDIANPPGALHRWLGAVPMFMTFAVGAIGLVRLGPIIDIFKSLRVDFPAPTVWLMWLYRVATPLYATWPPIMVVLALCYFEWACKSRKRLIWFNLLSTTLFLLVMLFVVGGSLLPLLKIQEALRKK